MIIPSSLNSRVRIDLADYDKIKHYTFSIDKRSSYVVGHCKTKTYYLHRLIMEESDPLIFIDHIDGNPMNNVRSNLRRSNSTTNSQNRSKCKNTTSKYIGVSFEKSKKKWRTTIHINGKTVLIGRFSNEIEAAIARDRYILNNLPNSRYRLSGLDLEL